MYVLLFQQSPVVNPGDGLGAAVYRDYDSAKAAWIDEIQERRQYDGLGTVHEDGDVAWGDDWSLTIIGAHDGTKE